MYIAKVERWLETWSSDGDNGFKGRVALRYIPAVKLTYALWTVSNTQQDKKWPPVKRQVTVFYLK